MSQLGRWTDDMCIISMNVSGFSAGQQMLRRMFSKYEKGVGFALIASVLVANVAMHYMHLRLLVLEHSRLSVLEQGVFDEYIWDRLLHEAVGDRSFSSSKDIFVTVLICTAWIIWTLSPFVLSTIIKSVGVRAALIVISVSVSASYASALGAINEGHFFNPNLIGAAPALHALFISGCLLVGLWKFCSFFLSPAKSFIGKCERRLRGGQ